MGLRITAASWRGRVVVELAQTGPGPPDVAGKVTEETAFLRLTPEEATGLLADKRLAAAVAEAGRLEHAVRAKKIAELEEEVRKLKERL